MGKVTVGPGLLILIYKILGKFQGGVGVSPKHDKRPPWEHPIRAIMATAWFCDPDCPRRRKGDIQKLKKAGYNAVYAVGDLAIPPNDNNNRWHIKVGRGQTSISDHVVRNIKWISSQGMRPIAVLDNEPTVRSGKSHGLGAFAGAHLQPKDMYTPARLENEKKIWRELLAKCGDFIYAIVPVLEPSQDEAIDFQKELCRFIRQDLKFKGPIYGNGFGNGRWFDPGTPYYVRSAGSIGTLQQWMSSSDLLKNLDGGNFLNAGNAEALIPTMIKKPGPDGWILYFDEYRDIGGPSKLQSYMIDPVKAALG